MGIKLYSEPKCENPVLLVGWPGIGNIGLIAIDTLRKAVHAEQIGEIEPWDFFYPSRVVISAGILEELSFPRNTFYYKRYEGRDLLFFIGDEQPAMQGKGYAEGVKAYQLASLVLDAGRRFGCRRVYTSGAAVAAIHHATAPRVWTVPTQPGLIEEIKRHQDTILMGEGTISGLNGLLLGMAKERGWEGICVMGEVPMYVAHFPLMYPKASRSVLQFLTRILHITLDLSMLDASIREVEEQIDEVYKKIPPEMREQLEKLKDVRPESPREQTGEAHEKEFMDNIGRLFEDINQSLQDERERDE